MPRDYDPSSVELKWQKRWEEAKAFEIDLRKAKKPYYNLVMFPYPSGDKLHVGHWYNFAPADSWGRYMRMRGHDVFEPMGFDAFGLPAENFAIKTGIHPAKSTAENMGTMIRQLKRIGCMYDWSRTLNTSEQAYYRWTQWLFLQMYSHGLAYKKEAPVNYCLHCKTVLAREQAQDGTCERCGTQVIQKPLVQWFWKITRYAEKLLRNLDDLDWPEKTKLMQRSWIGRSEGAEITFDIAGYDKKITVFTTRPDTLFGATYMVLAPEHSLVSTITSADHRARVEAYREEAAKKTELQRTDLAKEKTGVATGAFTVHPATQERIPIWIADYVLLTYGTGAVMAVPGHDERDWEFARKFGLPIKEVVQGGDLNEGAFTGEGPAVNSGFLTGLSVREAKKRMVAWLEDVGHGHGHVTYRLRDWLVSRQRYWGAPIPIVYDPSGKSHPIPEEHLPWLLPTDVEFRPTGESPLTYSREFKERTERLFGKGWTPECDTMDTFVCSSFYYLRYVSQSSGQEKFHMPHAKSQANSKARDSKSTCIDYQVSMIDSHLVDPLVEKKWMPVGMYIGGPEHACMHLIYARFVMMALKDFGFVLHEEPFKKLIHQGLITNRGAKMSKSKGNVVSPDAYVERYGSDVFRMYLMFMGPFTEGGDWSDMGMKGISRFVQRVWKFICFETLRKGKLKNKKVDQNGREVLIALHRTIQRVTESMEKMHFNTALSALMEFLNALDGFGNVPDEVRESFIRLLAPLAPHLAEELWEKAGGKGFVIDQPWPAFDPRLLVSETLTIVVQVNGKVRANVEVPADASREQVLSGARRHENVRKFLEGRTVQKEICVKGKIVNFVTSE